MSHVFIVTIDSSTKPPSLNIYEDDKSNEVVRLSDWQTIRWKLVGQAAMGMFNDQCADKPGFAWVGNKKNPPEGVFSEPVLRHRGRLMSMAVLNDYDPKSDPKGLNTTGGWTYQLSIMVDGKPYQSPLPKPKPRTTTNPRIKNT
jgi:hypothetical protein